MDQWKLVVINWWRFDNGQGNGQTDVTKIAEKSNDREYIYSKKKIPIRKEKEEIAQL